MSVCVFAGFFQLCLCLCACTCVCVAFSPWRVLSCQFSYLQQLIYFLFFKARTLNSTNSLSASLSLHTNYRSPAKIPTISQNWSPEYLWEYFTERSCLPATVSCLLIHRIWTTGNSENVYFSLYYTHSPYSLRSLASHFTCGAYGQSR